MREFSVENIEHVKFVTTSEDNFVEMEETEKFHPPLSGSLLVKSKILSTIFFTSGVSTLLQGSGSLKMNYFTSLGASVTSLVCDLKYLSSYVGKPFANYARRILFISAASDRTFISAVIFM